LDSNQPDTSKPNGKSKLTPTVSECLKNTGQLFDVGTTCELGPNQTQSGLMSSLEDFHVRTSVLPIQTEKDLPASEADCGRSSTESFADYDLITSSWKTCQLCLNGELAEFLEIWPKSGTTRNGIAYRRPPLVPTRFETGFSFMPTPNTEGYRSAGELIQLARRCSTVQEYVNLSHRAANSKRTRHWKDSQGIKPNGKENPEWIEWLMGYPIGWTDLEASATPSSRKSPNGSATESLPSKTEAVESR